MVGITGLVRLNQELLSPGSSLRRTKNCTKRFVQESSRKISIIDSVFLPSMFHLCENAKRLFNITRAFQGDVRDGK